MQRHIGRLTWVWGLIAAATPAAAQTEPQPPIADPSLGITVTATRLDEARSSIQPSLGATTYDFSRATIENVPLGENAPLNQVLLRAPGVVQDSFGQIHVRGDHGNVQYRLDGVQLPEGLSLFNNVLATRYANQMSLLTGALPAQYGLHTAGIVDITREVRHDRSRRRGLDHRRLARLCCSPPSPTAAAPARSTISRPASTSTTASASRTRPRRSRRFTTTPTSGTGSPRSPASSTRTRGSPSSPAAPAHASRSPTFPSRRRTSPSTASTTSNSSILDQRQWEKTYFGIASLQKSYEDVNFQLSGFARYSQPVLPARRRSATCCSTASRRGPTRTSFAAGVQGDGTWKVADAHTLRGGFLVQRERATSFTRAIPCR